MLKEKLSTFKKEFDLELTKILDKQLSDAQNVSLELEKLLSQMKKYSLAGGKRLRPFLFSESYRGLTNKPCDIVSLSCFVELVHLELLALDDIMDRSDTRHGVHTIHKSQQRDCEKSEITGGCAHFGSSAGILAGVMFGNIAMSVLANAPCSKKETLAVVDYYNKIIIDTAYGQYHDVYTSLKQAVSLDEVKRVHYYKTARYTIEAPLVAGAYMAGLTDAEIEPIREFSRPLGHAFQIVDDLIGTFGSKEALGKSPQSDLAEGKHTYLTVWALLNGNAMQKEELATLLNKGEASENDLERFKSLLKDTNAYKHSVSQSKEYLKEALKALEDTPFDSETRGALGELAHFIVQRDY
ncbi:polyprenyl synthetase family protein [Patescibacteria group bacterium]|nr:polyprenyl synthetase family protein [Patescibacteria group bacterium]